MEIPWLAVDRNGTETGKIQAETVVASILPAPDRIKSLNALLYTCTVFHVNRYIGKMSVQ